MIDLESTIISEYGNSSTIGQLIQNMNGYLDPRADIARFLSYVWNVQTAQGFGLDIWGRIVGIDRTVLTNPVYYLQDAPFRALILLKALSNISLATAPSINRLLLNWLGSGSRAYMTDAGNMQITYVFEFLLQPFQIVIMQNSGIFLRPAGVGGTMITAQFPVFGFAEMGTTWAAPFNEAPFLAEDATYAII